MRVPGFWDPRRRPERPDLTRLTVLRFLTEIDYPPFNFAGPDGNPQGFNVDLARMMCEEIKLACTIQMRRFETLIPALNANQGDAVIASIAATRRHARQGRFHRPLLSHAGALRGQARLADRRPAAREARRQEGRGRRRHRARGLSQGAVHRGRGAPYPSSDVARLALRKGDVDLLFGDAISLAFWLNGTDSENCCSFRGGPYMDSRYFGEGIGIVVKQGNDTHADGAELGAVPGVGAGPLHRSVAALFPGQPVLMDLMHRQSIDGSTCHS